MILYLSSGTDQSLFEQYQNEGIVNCGFQAQKFNYLVISGISKHTDIVAVANIPYANSRKEVPERIIEKEHATFICTKNTIGKAHKLKNLLNLKRVCRRIFAKSNVEGIVCDAINPLASLLTLYYAKKKQLKAIAIVTDLPFYMDENHVSIFTRLTQYLLERYDGYVLLTEAMNPIANPKGKPYIVMEGLCEVTDEGEFEVKKRNSFVYTGSLSRGTGIEEMMRGFVSADLEGIFLDIYGRGEMEEEIKRFSSEHPQVRFCGAVKNSEIIVKQREALLLVNPRPINIGYAEFSFPSKIMEYMASGTPVLTTHLPGIPEEYFSYVYECDGSEKGFTEAFKVIYSKSEKELKEIGRCAKKFVMEKKNKYAQTKKILEILSKL